MSAPRELSWQEEYRRRFYTSRRGWIDGTPEFHALIKDCYTPSDKILEVGAGPSNPTSDFLATLGALSAVDPDADVLSNRSVEDAKILDGDRFPFDDAQFGLCVSNYVVEHIANAAAHLSEVARVLRPGGRYVFRTVNRNHYLGLISWLTPHFVHTLIANRARGLPAESHEPYPTVYALNTANAIRRAAGGAGFEVEQLRYVEKEPTYAQFSRMVYLGMVAYERAVNALPSLAPLRVNLFVVLRKPRGEFL